MRGRGCALFLTNDIFFWYLHIVVCAVSGDQGGKGEKGRRGGWSGNVGGDLGGGKGRRSASSTRLLTINEGMTVGRYNTPRVAQPLETTFVFSQGRDVDIPPTIFSPAAAVD